MPNYDGTGPDGKGPMTGLGRGYCVLPISSPGQEYDFLANRARVLQMHLEAIKDRIQTLEKKNTVYK